MSAAAAGALTRNARQDVDGAYAWCREYARRHDENFTAVSWFLPNRLRPHFFAVYAFCRWTDDLGDEAEGDRLALLEEWDRDLRACFDGERELPLFVALGATIDAFAMQREPFLRLIEANRMDQRVASFETYADLQRYCEHSATPVGRMVLQLLGYADEERGRLADAKCTGLQLANFWQDVSVDLAKERVYLPVEDMRRFGYGLDELCAGVVNDSFLTLMRFEVERARELFREGRRLEEMVDRRARTDVRLFRLGGEAVLDAIERAGYGVLSARPRVRKAKKAWMALSTGVRMKAGL
jgi:squalene synthase HpnC